MAQSLPKRFYKSVTIDSSDGAWRVMLDERQIRTPGKLKLTLPNEGVAKKVAAEWEAQTDIIDPASMPVTRLANVACEQTPLRRDDLVEEAVRYAGTDLICYRAPQPRVLRDRQAAAWEVWREWATEQGVDLDITDSLTAIEQNPDSLHAVKSYAEGLDDFSLTLFVHLVAVYGSVVLALAVMKQALPPDEAFDLSRVDNAYQIELWGEDEAQAEIDAALREETMTLGQLAGWLT